MSGDKKTFWISKPEKANGEYIGRVDYAVIAESGEKALEKAQEIFTGVWGSWDLRLENEKTTEERYLL